MPRRRVPQLWVRLDGQGTLFGQLYRAMRQAILSGELAPGARLPSTRTLARDLGMSRSTTMPVYDQLIAEGYLVSRHGSGTTVAEDLPERGRSAPRRGKAHPPRAPRLSEAGRRLARPELAYPYDALAQAWPARFEFVYGLPELAAFPREPWRRIVSRRLARAGLRSLAYAPPEGLHELREAIATYLQRARGVRCSADQVLVTSGAQQALHLVAGILLDPGDAVLIEEPHYLGARVAFLAEGAELVPAPIDDEGLDLGAVPERDLERCVLAYATPSHQFPVGTVLSLRRRLALLAWAQRRDAYIIEDDYDSEFRYSGRPIESLQALDEAGRVIYVGTFSKVLFSGLRLGYVVAPAELARPLRSAKWTDDWSTATFEQEALAEFIRDGHFDRHLRRMRARYGARRAAMREALEEELADDVRLTRSDAGLHLVAWLPGLLHAKLPLLVEEARRRDVGVHPIDPYFLAAKRAPSALVLGYTLLDEDAIREGIRRLGGALRKVAS